MRILALEPYHGGSHRAFLEGWARHSGHQFGMFTLSPRKWKWRMRHAAVTLADSVREAAARGEGWDALLCSDMLNLAEFRGLAPAPVRDLPSVAYFHENQLTYPVDHPSDFDYHFAFTNLTTALAADAVWWNSAFHRESMLEGLESFLRRMPDHRPLDSIERIRAKSEVRPPGIHHLPRRGGRRPGPLRILWAARWEADKGPDTFFRALDLLDERGVEFRVSVIGGGGARNAAPAFDAAKGRHGDRILHWGWAESRAAYEAILQESDVFVSTARHEFFGIAAVEAAAAGALPLLPRRLAYPEVFGEDLPECLYDGGEEELAGRLQGAAEAVARGETPGADPDRLASFAARYAWPRVSADHDARISAIVKHR